MALRQFKGEKERKENLKHLSKSRPLGPLLKRSLSDSTGMAPGSTITLPVTTDHTLIGQEAIDGQKIIDKYDLATRGGKKSRKKKRKKKKKSRKKRGSCKGWNCFRKSNSGQFAKTKPGYHQVKPQESSQSKIPKTKSGVFPKELRRRSPIPDPLVKPMKFAHADTATSAHRSLYKSGHTFDDSFLKKPIPKKPIEFGKGKGGKRSRKKRKRKRKKKKKSRRRKKKAGFLLEGALGYYLYQTKMKGKKAIFNWPVQYKDQEPVAQDAPADPTPPPATGGKKSRKKHRRKSKKTRKKRGGADTLRDGIKQIYKGIKASKFSTPTGPGSWGGQLQDLYNSYQEHLYSLSRGQKVARKFKNLFRNAKTKKPLTEGEADIIFHAEANTMKSLLKDMLLRKRASIDEINMNPDAMLYSAIERDSDPEKERLSTLIEEEIPRLSEEAEQLNYSIIKLDVLMDYIKRSSNSIPRHGSSIETNLGSMDPLPYVSGQRYRGLSSTPPPEYIEV